MHSVAPLLLLLLVACGTPSEASDAGPFVPDDGGVVKLGSVVLQQTTAAGASQGAISASFTTNANRVGCSRRVDGPCTVVLCGTGAGASTTFQSAGTLTVRAAALDGGVVTLEPSAGATYQLITAALWRAPNQPLTITAAGAQVPAFSLTLPSPSTITVNSPTCTVNAPCTVSRSAPFTVSWSGGTTGSVVIDLFSQQGTAPSADVSCTFSASAGSATIPASTMRQLISGSGSIRVWATSTATQTVADYAVTVSASSAPFVAAGVY